MEIRVEDNDLDFGTLVVIPGRDDSFEVSGYGERGQISIRIPLFNHEAREMIKVLTPIAESEDQ